MWEQTMNRWLFVIALDSVSPETSAVFQRTRLRYVPEDIVCNLQVSREVAIRMRSSYEMRQ
jgi:hypothetical protein